MVVILNFLVSNSRGPGPSLVPNLYIMCLDIYSSLWRGVSLKYIHLGPGHLGKNSYIMKERTTTVQLCIYCVFHFQVLPMFDKMASRCFFSLQGCVRDHNATKSFFVWFRLYMFLLLPFLVFGGGFPWQPSYSFWVSFFLLLHLGWQHSVEVGTESSEQEARNLGHRDEVIIIGLERTCQ